MKVSTFYRFAYLLLAIMASGFFISSNAQDPDVRGMGGVGITVFRDINFQGSAATYTSNQSNLGRSGFNNTISSIRVGPGERWEICDLPNYGGQCVVVFGQESDLRQNGWNDRISSMRRVGGGGGGGIPPGPSPSGSLVLFNSPNYRGQSATYNLATPNLYGANNRAQSATVSGGEWELCQGVNFTGRCIRLSRSTPNLANFGMRNRVSSVRPIGYNPPPPSGGTGSIVLYSQKNYVGNQTAYERADPSIGTPALSATVGAGTWLLCDGRSYTGRCITLNQSVWDLTNYNIGRIIRSIRPVQR